MATQDFRARSVIESLKKRGKFRDLGRADIPKGETVQQRRKRLGSAALKSIREREPVLVTPVDVPPPSEGVVPTAREERLKQSLPRGERGISRQFAPTPPTPFEQEAQQSIDPFRFRRDTPPPKIIRGVDPELEEGFTRRRKSVEPSGTVREIEITTKGVTNIVTPLTPSRIFAEDLGDTLQRATTNIGGRGLGGRVAGSKLGQATFQVGTIAGAIKGVENIQARLVEAGIGAGVGAGFEVARRGVTHIRLPTLLRAGGRIGSRAIIPAVVGFEVARSLRQGRNELERGQLVGQRLTSLASFGAGAKLGGAVTRQSIDITKMLNKNRALTRRTLEQSADLERLIKTRTDVGRQFVSSTRISIRVGKELTPARIVSKEIKQIQTTLQGGALSPEQVTRIRINELRRLEKLGRLGRREESLTTRIDTSKFGIDRTGVQRLGREGLTLRTFNIPAPLKAQQLAITRVIRSLEGGQKLRFIAQKTLPSINKEFEKFVVKAPDVSRVMKGFGKISTPSLKIPSIKPVKPVSVQVQERVVSRADLTRSLGTSRQRITTKSIEKQLEKERAASAARTRTRLRVSQRGRQVTVPSVVQSQRRDISTILSTNIFQRVAQKPKTGQGVRVSTAQRQRQRQRTLVVPRLFQQTVQVPTTPRPRPRGRGRTTTTPRTRIPKTPTTVPPLFGLTSKGDVAKELRKLTKRNAKFRERFTPSVQAVALQIRGRQAFNVRGFGLRPLPLLKLPKVRAR